jgi:Ca2+-binding EF-hand superfamily protein
MTSDGRPPHRADEELYGSVRGDDGFCCRVLESLHTPLGLMDSLIDKGDSSNLQRSLSETSVSSDLGNPVTSEVSTGNSVNCAKSPPISAARREHIERVFFQFSCPFKATMAIADLGMVIRFLGVTMTPDQIQKVAEEADEDGGGALDFEEFMKMAIQIEGNRKLRRSDTGSSTNLSAVSTAGSSSQQHVNCGPGGGITRRQQARMVFTKCRASEDRLEARDLGTALKLVGHMLPDAEVAVLAKKHADGKGELDVGRFLDMVEILDARAERQEELRRVFSRCKADDVIEARSLCAALHLAGHCLSEAEADALAKEADDDGSGTLDFDEFLAMVERLDGDATRRS